MRQYLAPVPGKLGILAEQGLLEICERLDCLRSRHYPPDQIAWLARFEPLANSITELAEENDAPERYGLVSDDWRWKWGTRFECGKDILELRSFVSFRGDRASVFDHCYEHTVVDFNDVRVLELRLGADHPERRPLVIAVGRLVVGPWVHLLVPLVNAARP